MDQIGNIGFVNADQPLLLSNWLLAWKGYYQQVYGGKDPGCEKRIKSSQLGPNTEPLAKIIPTYRVAVASSYL